MMIAFACRRGRNGVLRRMCLASMIGFAVATTAWAQVPGSMRDYALPAASLTQSINAIGQSNGVQVIYDAALLQGKMAGAISGHFTLSQALDRALARSGLTYELVNSGRTVVIRKLPAPPPQDDTSTVPGNESTTVEEDAEPTRLGAVTVTGTRIRGGSTPSPVITIGFENIREEGFTDLGDVIRNIPQNFGGGQNPGISGRINNSNSNYNTTGGSDLNLRGLGADATLTLLNGRRMSYGGGNQAVDISAIPVDAVERIEIVPDGASAIYGSDAVGGVANVVLKRDFDGVTLGARYGGATDGGQMTHEYTATAGTTWSSGGLIATWKKASSDPIYSDQRDYARSMYRLSTLWQGNDLSGGLFAIHQSLGDSVELSLDVLNNERDALIDTAYLGGYYHYTPKTKTSLVSPSLELQLPHDWMLTVSVALGKDKTYSLQDVIDGGSGGILSSSRSAYSNKSRAFEIGAEGGLFTLLGGDARLAAGAGYRYNSMLVRGITSNRVVIDDDESSRFAYAELNLPLIAPEQGVPAVDRLVLTGAVRTEDYDNYGRVTTPKFGFVYSPSPDFALKTSWGKSFKVPTFLQRYSIQGAYLYTPASFGGTGYPADATVLFRSGGSVALSPERARTWSTTLAFHPEAVPGLETELTWFDINYTDRVGQPMTNITQALSSYYHDVYGDFIIDNPSAEVLAGAIADSANFYNYAGVSYDPDKVAAIVDNRSVNAARQKIKGIDLSGAYRLDLADGQVAFRGSVAWLDSKQALTSTQSLYDLSGTLFSPARLNGRIGAVWNRGGVMVSAFGNYKSGVKDTTEGTKGASFTTFDGTVRYDMGEHGGVFANVVFEFTARNLLNRAPPSYTVASPLDAPYDSLNYSAIGRFLSLSVSKHW
jgi:outer membrane receptor protein involved in Fe transport